MTRRALRGLGMFAQRGAVPAAAIAAPSRQAMVDVLGLACYIVWSFAFWNGPLLPTVEGGQAGMLAAPAGHRHEPRCACDRPGLRPAWPRRTRRSPPGCLGLHLHRCRRACRAGPGGRRLDALGSRLCPERRGELPAPGVGGAHQRPGREVDMHPDSLCLSVRIRCLRHSCGAAA